MATKRKAKPVKQDDDKPVDHDGFRDYVKAERPKVETAELAAALKGMVTAAMDAGGRDRPEVIHANEVLAKLRGE